ncbi:diguanylate cyclase domain protein [Paraburkholderia xenovorans LB400]|uniref:Diguanylate cyclase(GGDEF)/ phosphodiesterase(EAL) with PAS/PAC and GAF sensors n=1 Tax=Paraburkholderia xenovorans (strain LB400) TaxID=266265 RepID=Q13IZ7_PARXL|nr:EAL domain-containing protein [Paraburkholderia xenovorans]ABE35942.1 Putative diguanylate cyclase(GGDEF)/ phosphodiesterase(EAL) with PAS/PAC and GAF sensors [Paraburkholderia xenovorans LB400]AIP34699.1 diguanylate cyclase domain protein [Paraburkholderia xenovorans LB400]
MAQAQIAGTLVQVLAQIPDAVVLVDEDGAIGFFNPAAEALWGLTAAAVLGADAGMLLPRGIQPAGHGVQTGNVDGPGLALQIERNDGVMRRGQMSIHGFEVAGRRFRAAFIRDITDQHRQCEEWQQLLRVVNGSDNAIIVASLDGSISFINSGVTRMLGYAAAEVQGLRLVEPFAGVHTNMAAVERIQSAAREPSTPDHPFRQDLLVYTKGGRPLWVNVGITVITDNAGAPVNLLAVLTDITLTRMREELQQKVLDAMARELPATEVAGILCREVERIAPEVVATFLRVDDGRLFTLAAPRLPVTVTRAMDGESIGPCAGSCGTAAWRGTPVVVTDIASDPLWTGYRDLVLPLGLAACWSYPVKGADGSVLGTFAFYYRENHGPVAFHQSLVDMGLSLCALLLEREKARMRIHQLAFHDTLTGLPNRNMFETQAQQLLNDARRTERELALVFIDLDHFKRVNDTRGHATGDEVLCETGRRFKSVLRDGDLLGRLAGDEFVAILPHCGVHQATGIVERLLAATAPPVVVAGAPIHASASIGIAMYPADGEHVPTLLRQADIAMYHAKARGRGHFCFFREEMSRNIQEQAMLEADLRVALKHDLLDLWYQPQFDAANGHVLSGVEALLRWNHATLGSVPPVRFVVLAEECGLIGELGKWVTQRACRQLADWRARGVEIPRVSINLSASDFRDSTLAERVARTLLAHGLQPHDLTLEMTESVMLGDEPGVLSMIDELHRLGIQLSLDDFGTGYSSLGYLHRLPLDELKLDRSFVRDLDHSDSARALTSTVLRIGESLNIKVVAEGVETDTQRQFLVEHGCPVLQGYLLARPMAPHLLEEWLRAAHAGSRI